MNTRTFKNVNKYVFFLFVGFFFLFISYLSIPLLYNVEKIRPILEKQLLDNYDLNIKLDKEIEYFMKDYKGDDNQGSLNCSKNGQYLFSTLQHTFSSSEVKKDWEYSQNANGFLLKFNIRESMANELLKNKTLLKLNESE